MLENTAINTPRTPLLEALFVWKMHAKRNFGKRRNLLVEGIPRECNILTAQRQLINSASYARIFEIKMMVDTNNGPQKVQAMIDSGATRNIMSEDLARRKGFPRNKKKDPYDLAVVDVHCQAEMEMSIKITSTKRSFSSISFG